MSRALDWHHQFMRGLDAHHQSAAEQHATAARTRAATAAIRLGVGDAVMRSTSPAPPRRARAPAAAAFGRRAQPSSPLANRRPGAA